MNINDFWINFLKENDLSLDTKYFEAFAFGLTENTANSLLSLVLSGKKRATSSSIYPYQNNMPKIGDLSILTDYNNIPYCIIETTKITSIPFKDMTFELCSKEGEDDSLESWKNNHIDFFTKESIELGYKFDENMIVIFEEFKIVYQRPYMDVRKYHKESFSIIGKTISTENSNYNILKLWNNFSENFDSLNSLLQNNNTANVWGAMSDLSLSFKPWESNYSVGLYMAGVEVKNDINCPYGYEKWTLPTWNYFYIKVQNNYGECMNYVLNYIQESSLKLIGAIQEYYNSKENGQMYLLFPIG